MLSLFCIQSNTTGSEGPDSPPELLPEPSTHAAVKAEVEGRVEDEEEMVDMGQTQPGWGDIIPAGPGISAHYLLDANIALYTSS